MATEAQRKASAKYDKTHTKSILLKLNTTSDADILAKLDGVANKQGYIKELIRNNICGSEEVLPIDALRLMVLPVIQKFSIDKATLFGSYARGDATSESDVDLLIECDSIRSMKDYFDLQEGLRIAIGKNVDVVMADALDSDKSRAGKRLREHIEKDKVILFERLK